MLELKSVSSGYGKNTVLREASVRFEKGKVTALIGPNGSGKSTLLRTALGLIPAKSGEIIIDGENLASIKRQDVAKKIAFLPQGKNVPDMTVEQMVLHGRFPHLSYPRRYSENDIAIANFAIEQMGLKDYKKAPLNKLSGGMRQKAYIAMCLAQDTDYILLDEPTTYLDIAHNLELMKMIGKLKSSGKGIVAVMHDLPLAFDFSDYTVVLNDGKIIMQDKTENVADSGIIKRIFGVDIYRNNEKGSFSYKY